MRIGRGFYATAELAATTVRLGFGEHFLSAYAAIGALGPGAVASHRTAAHIHGLDLLTGPGRIVTLTRPPGRGSRSAKSGVHLHVARLATGHVSHRFGLPITTVARTVVDLARTTSFREGVVAADSALHQHLTSKKELLGVLADCRRAPGSFMAAQVVEFADGLAESALESIARAAFHDCRLPAPARARAQLRRDKKLREAGYEVVHFDWREINSDPAAVASSIRAAFRRGSQRRSAGPAA